MNTSHLQTRTLTDALDAVDAILAVRATGLRLSEERQQLAGCFAPQSRPEFLHWAFSASEYDEMAVRISERAPELRDRLHRPRSDLDFTVVGHCSLDLRFCTDANGAVPVPHKLRDGSRVDGARVTSGKALLYSSGLVSLPTIDGKLVYLVQPAAPPTGTAAQIAAMSFAHRGAITCEGLAITFPQARTEHLPAYTWVTQLTSEDNLYSVRNFVNSGEAILNENGFFARETQVVQLEYLAIPEARHRVIIDGPFLVFFADDSGVHAAAWFARDSFTLLA